jgi:Glycosyl hydrolase family 59
MRVVVAGAAVLACGLACLAGPLSAAASPAARSGAGAPAVTRITLDPGQGGRVYDGVGGVLGGGGNARYLMDYPATQRQQIMNYLFKPDYGASLQILKLEIGGDADTSDGAEPSIEHTRGHINCHAGYEFAIARQAVALNPGLKLYGLQWAAPGWVDHGGGRFTTRDISYLLNWLGCARRQGLRISYLGGWNESDDGTHQGWWKSLRQALNQHGYRQVRLVAPDSTGSDAWHYVGDPAIAVLGAHDVCGAPTGAAGPATECDSPWSLNSRRDRSGQPMWASELGGMSAGATRGCTEPCAPAIDRAVIRGFADARLTGFLEWPVLDAMPSGLPFENRGLVTADQPWSGSYQVNAMTWATAQLTQFAAPPVPGRRVVWRYVSSASGLLDGRTADGSYVSLVRTRGGPATAWSTMIEATTASSVQRVSFHVTGASALARQTVHVWASNFDPSSGGPRQWFVRQPAIHPSRDGRFSLVIRPGWVYSLTTTTGQRKGAARGRPAAALRLPLTESLGSDARAGSADDEPLYLAAQQGAFELARCTVPDGGDRRCTEQQAAATPVFWHHAGSLPGTRYPYAVIGAPGWASYKVSVDVLLPSQHSSAGVIGRFSCRDTTPNGGAFDGYVFDVGATGRWSLTRNANPDTAPPATGCTLGPARAQLLASGRLASSLGTGRWHHLALAMSGSAIRASVDGTAVASVSDPTWSTGLAGLEAGAFSSSWPHVQYSHLAVTPLG